MSAQIIETTTNSGVKVSVNLEGRREYFDCLDKAYKWLREMKRLYEAERIDVSVRQIVLMSRKELKYESCYSM